MGEDIAWSMQGACTGHNSTMARTARRNGPASTNFYKEIAHWTPGSSNHQLFAWKSEACPASSSAGDATLSGLALAPDY